MQNDNAILRQAGLGIAAISYDSPRVLRDFARRKSIAFPLLSDHESQVIQAYGVADRRYRKGMFLDVDKETVTYSLGDVPVFGLSYPAVFVLGRDRRVAWRVVSEDSELRLTGAAILNRAVGVQADQVRTPVASRNVQVTATATNASAALGNRVSIGLELSIPKGFHVYGPQVPGEYKPISWTMAANSCLDIGEASYPAVEWQVMPATGERLPVYEGTVRLARELVVRPMLKASDPTVYDRFVAACVDSNSNLTASGALTLQACDDSRCYPPETVPAVWRFRFLPPDRERSPVEIRREFEQ